MYAIPYEYYEKYGVRRYGFHGTSHKYVSHRAAEFLEEPIERLKLITCHLGNGSSIAAVDQGKVIDTSMGMTPLAGLMMGTRCGDLDPCCGQLPEVQPGDHRPRAGRDPEQEVRPAGCFRRFQRQARRGGGCRSTATSAHSWPAIC